uniref:Fido domain-containing protein n=1 Tax=Rodentolepis nana TaxID=102285 RepID=A0A0R3TJM8_RODNA
LYSGFIEYKILSSLNSLVKSSTIYIIVQKFAGGYTISDCSQLGCLKDQRSSDYASRYRFLHSPTDSKYVRIAKVISVGIQKEAEMSILSLTTGGKNLDHALLSPNDFIKSLSSEQAHNLVKAEGLYTKALISDPLNIRAVNNQKRMSSIVKEIDQQRYRKIDSKVARFYLVPDSDPGLKKVKVEHYFLHIYHSNAIEGNTLSLAQTRSLLETRLALGGKSLQEQNEVLGLDAAFKYLNNTLLTGTLTRISLGDILELHRRVLSFVDISEAGRLRKTQVFVGDHTPPPASMLPELMEELIDWVNSEEALALHPIELAALTHWKLVYIHPFYDGNGRTSRLVMNLILMRAGYPPAIVRKEDRSKYYEYLKSANEGDVRPFIRFIGVFVSAANRPIATQVGSLMPYTALPLHFPWLPHEQSSGRSHVIYSN